MSGNQDTSVKELLSSLECTRENNGVIQIRGHIAKLREDLRQSRTSQAGSGTTGGRLSNRNKHNFGACARKGLEIWGKRQRDIRTHSINADREQTWALDYFASGLSCHGKRVFATVDGYSKSLHDVAHCFACFVHSCTFTLELGGPHPVRTAFYIIQSSDTSKYKVRQGLGHGHAGHGAVVDETLDGLFANRSSDTGKLALRGGEVRLCNDTYIGEGCVQGSHTRLLCNKASNRAVHLGGKKAL
mmetsp:Transcript_9349/g.17213  ORF Transcript_9349/g.17213 Transcript_9349/m.17213 type:complete len:244 (+) Transcript_9349:1408-2139(+)